MEVGGASGVNAGHRDEAHPDAVSHPIGQGFSTKGAASKRRTGSNEKVTNILAHIAMQRESALTRGEKNRVAKKLYLMAAQNPDPEPPRDSRRLNTLRGWSHEEDKQVVA